MQTPSTQRHDHHDCCRWRHHWRLSNACQQWSARGWQREVPASPRHADGTTTAESDGDAAPATLPPPQHPIGSHQCQPLGCSRIRSSRADHTGVNRSWWPSQSIQGVSSAPSSVSSRTRSGQRHRVLNTRSEAITTAFSRRESSSIVQYPAPRSKYDIAGYQAVTLGLNKRSRTDLAIWMTVLHSMVTAKASAWCLDDPNLVINDNGEPAEDLPALVVHGLLLRSLGLGRRNRNHRRP